MGKRILPIQLWDGDIVITVIIIIFTIIAINVIIIMFAIIVIKVIIIIVAIVVINVLNIIVITASVFNIIPLWSGQIFSINDANTVIYAKTITIHVN